MMLWKMVMVGTFTFVSNQSFQFNDHAIKQSVQLTGSVDLKATGFKDQKECEAQIAAIPATLKIQGVLVTIDSKSCMADPGPIT